MLQLDEISKKEIFNFLHRFPTNPPANKNSVEKQKSSITKEKTSALEQKGTAEERKSVVDDPVSARKVVEATQDQVSKKTSPVAECEHQRFDSIGLEKSSNFKKQEEKNRSSSNSTSSKLQESISPIQKPKTTQASDRAGVATSDFSLEGDSKAVKDKNSKASDKHARDVKPLKEKVTTSHQMEPGEIPSKK